MERRNFRYPRLSRALLWATLLFALAYFAVRAADEWLGLGAVDPGSAVGVDSAVIGSIESDFYTRVKASLELMLLFSTAGFLVFSTAGRLPTSVTWVVRFGVVVALVGCTARLAGWDVLLRQRIDPDLRARAGPTEVEIRAFLEAQAPQTPTSSALRLTPAFLPKERPTPGWRVASLSSLRIADDGSIDLYGIFRRPRPASAPGLLVVDPNGKHRSGGFDELGELFVEVRDLFPAEDGRLVLLGRSRFDLDQSRLLPHAFAEDGSPDHEFAVGFLEVFDRINHLRRLADGRWLAVGRLAGSDEFSLRRFDPRGRLDPTFDGTASFGYILHFWLLEGGRCVLFERVQSHGSILTFDPEGRLEDRIYLPDGEYFQQVTRLSDGSFLARSQPFRPRGARLYVARSGDHLTGIALRLLGSAGRWREIEAWNQYLLGPRKLWAGDPLLIPQAVTAAAKKLPVWAENPQVVERFGADGKRRFRLRYPLLGAIAGVLEVTAGRLWVLGFQRDFSRGSRTLPGRALAARLSLEGEIEDTLYLPAGNALMRVTASLLRPDGSFVVAGMDRGGGRIDVHHPDGSQASRSASVYHRIHRLRRSSGGRLLVAQKIQGLPYDAAGSLRLTPEGQIVLGAEGLPVPAPALERPKPPPWVADLTGSPRTTPGMYQDFLPISGERWTATFRPWSSKNGLQHPVIFDRMGGLDNDFAHRARVACEAIGRIREKYREPSLQNRITILREDREGRILLVLSSGSELNDTLLRLESSGDLDRGFHPPNGNLESVHDIRVDPDGDLYLAGKFAFQGKTYGLLRLAPGGRARRFSLGPRHLAEDR